MADKTATTRTNTDNRGGYTADLVMKVTNHKDVKADVVVIFNNPYGSNLRLTMKGADAKPENVSAQEFRWRKTLLPDEVWSFGWKEDYFV